MALDADGVRGVYTKLAPLYDLLTRYPEARARRLLLERAAPRNGERILEVAVGTGLLFRDLVAANPSGTTTGVDLTEAMLARARSKLSGVSSPNVTLRVGDAHNLDFATGSFDLVVASYFFDLLPETSFVPVLKEMKRVLSPGGRLAIANLAGSDRWMGRLWNRLWKASPRLVGGCRPVSLRGAVEAAGLTIVSCEEVRQLFLVTEIVTAR